MNRINSMGVRCYSLAELELKQREIDALRKQNELKEKINDTMQATLVIALIMAIITVLMHVK